MILIIYFFTNMESVAALVFNVYLDELYEVNSSGTSSHLKQVVIQLTNPAS